MIKINSLSFFCADKPSIKAMDYIPCAKVTACISHVRLMDVTTTCMSRPHFTYHVMLDEIKLFFMNQLIQYCK